MIKYVFDLDNTLVFTDLLNNFSYNYALSQYGLPPINDCRRITRDVISDKYSFLNDVQKKDIIKLKQNYFVNNVNMTLPNLTLFQFLKNQSPDNCILWTSADQVRVIAILEYYHIEKEFNEILFSNKINIKNDISNICNVFDCNSESLVFYEDNQSVIQQLEQLRLSVVPINPDNYLSI